MEAFVQPRVLSWEGLEVPADFPYLAAIFQGPPTHDRDAFALRHPRMEREKRAKIFAPFDALDGYGDAVRGKDVAYVDRIDLSEAGLAEEERAELARRLAILRSLTRTGRLARRNRVTVAVTYFVPCADENSFAYGVRGLYRQAVGICRGVDPELAGTITVDGAAIPLSEVVAIEAEGVFDRAWETDAP